MDPLLTARAHSQELEAGKASVEIATVRVAHPRTLHDENRETHALLGRRAVELIAAELPGIDEQDVEVSLSGDILTIQAEKRAEHAEKGRDHRIVERARGSFSRSLRLLFAADPAQIRAMVGNGVLTITIPKPREAREKTTRIEVTRQDSGGAAAPEAGGPSGGSDPGRGQ